MLSNFAGSGSTDVRPESILIDHMRLQDERLAESRVIVRSGFSQACITSRLEGIHIYAPADSDLSPGSHLLCRDALLWPMPNQDTVIMLRY